MRRNLISGVVIAAVVLAGATGTAGAVTSATPSAQPAVTVGGAVSLPATYDPTQLAALPQTSATLAQGLHVSGVSLLDLVSRSTPQFPAGKNTFLRATAVVTGRNGSAAFALGELDPGFGNHPALIALGVEGRAATRSLTLVVPGDRGAARTVAGVTSVDVEIAAAPDLPAPPDGAVVVTDGTSARTLTPADLVALPAQSRTVQFLAAGAPQTHVETGPTLAAVLSAACVRPTKATSVAAVADDGYLAAVTPGEATAGGRVLLLSLVEDGTTLAQPRLVPDGDVKGGRYVSGVLYLLVSTPLACTRT